MIITRHTLGEQHLELWTSMHVIASCAEGRQAPQAPTTSGHSQARYMDIISPVPFCILTLRLCAQQPGTVSTKRLKIPSAAVFWVSPCFGYPRTQNLVFWVSPVGIPKTLTLGERNVKQSRLGCSPGYSLLIILLMRQCSRCIVTIYSHDRKSNCPIHMSIHQ